MPALTPALSLGERAGVRADQSFPLTVIHEIKSRS
jgi:hypothetical protein